MITPDNFRGDPYGEATNQLSHTMLGCVVVALFCLGWFSVAGELPSRAAAFSVCFLPYPLIVELAIQGWRKADTVFDSLMYGCGVLGVLLPFRDISVSGPPELQLQPAPFFGLVFFWAGALGMRVHKRWKQKNDAK